MTYDPEREHVRAALELQQERFDRASAALLPDLDLYRDDWSSCHAEMMRAHNERMRRLEDGQRQWLTQFINGDADEAAPTDAQGQVGASTAGRNAPASSGPGPGQPSFHEAELQHAREIADMDMATYAARRAELGVRPATSMGRLFG